AAVPRADVLADVAPVHLRAELGAVLLRDRPGRLAQVRKAARGVERARLVERARRAGVDAERARPAVECKRLRALELDVGDHGAENDPRAVPVRDQHRVLAVEPDPGADGSLAVDVVVLVDEYAVFASQPPAERIQLLAELRVGVEPRVAREAPISRSPLRLIRVV